MIVTRYIRLFAVTYFVLFWACCGATAQIRFSVSAPVFSYVFDAKENVLKTILGFPGNSIVADPVELGFPISQGVVLSDHRHVIASSPSFPELLLVHLEGDSVSVSTIAETLSAPDRIELSSGGNSAAIYYGASESIVILSGLPHSATVSRKIELSGFVGSPKAIAINDAGTSLLLAYSEGEHELVYAWSESGDARFVLSVLKTGALTFFGNENAIVADNEANEVYEIRDVQGQAAKMLLADARDGISKPVGVAVSDLGQIHIANASSSTVMTLETESRTIRVTECACIITGIHRMADSTFRLTDGPGEPIFVFETSPGADRIVFIPAGP